MGLCGTEDHLSVLLITYLPSPVLNPNSKNLGPKQSDFVSGIRGSRGFPFGLRLWARRVPSILAIGLMSAGFQEGFRVYL